MSVPWNAAENIWYGLGAYYSVRKYGDTQKQTKNPHWLRFARGIQRPIERAPNDSSWNNLSNKINKIVLDWDQWVQ